MIPVVAWAVRDYQFLEPLDTSSTNLPRNDNSQGFAMIRSKHLSVHRPGEHHTPVWIHDPIELDGCPIVAVRLHEISKYMLSE